MGVCLEKNFWIDLVIVMVDDEDPGRGVWVLSRWAVVLLWVHFIECWLNGFVNHGLDKFLFVCEQ
jgi:hypothetical protein